MYDNNIDKVIQQGDFLYFVTKDGKDKPLDAHCKNILLFLTPYYSQVTCPRSQTRSKRRCLVKLEEHILKELKTTSIT